MEDRILDDLLAQPQPAQPFQATWIDASAITIENKLLFEEWIEGQPQKRNQQEVAY